MKLPIETDTGTERLRILRQVGEGDQAWLEGDATVVPGAGPPLHVHHMQEERFRVVRGRLGYAFADGTPHYAEPGEEVVFPAGVAHRFWNAGETELYAEAAVSPAGNFAWFMSRLHDSIRRNGGGKPGFFEGAFLLHRYGSEFDLLDVPKAVKKVVFPVAVAIGHVLGRYRRYADAPPPLRPAGGHAGEPVVAL